MGGWLLDLDIILGFIVVNVYGQYIQAYQEKIKELENYINNLNSKYEEEKNNFLKEKELLNEKISAYEKGEKSED